MTCVCTGKVLSVPAPCPVHWPDGVVKAIEAGAAKANAKGAGMLTWEQFAEVEKVVNAFVATRAPNEPLGWFTAASTLLHAVRSQLVMKVEVSPTATATGTIEGLDGLGRRVGQG